MSVLLDLGVATLISLHLILVALNLWNDPEK